MKAFKDFNDSMLDLRCRQIRSVFGTGGALQRIWLGDIIQPLALQLSSNLLHILSSLQPLRGEVFTPFQILEMTLPLSCTCISLQVTFRRFF